MKCIYGYNGGLGLICSGECFGNRKVPITAGIGSYEGAGVTIVLRVRSLGYCLGGMGAAQGGCVLEAKLLNGLYQYHGVPGKPSVLRCRHATQGRGGGRIPATATLAERRGSTWHQSRTLSTGANSAMPGVGQEGSHLSRRKPIVLTRQR